MGTPKTDKLFELLQIYITGRLRNYHMAERNCWSDRDDIALTRLENELKNSIADAIGEGELDGNFDG